MFDNIARWAPDGGHIRLAQPRGRLDQRVEHSRQIERRAADDLEHVGGSSLLLKRFAQLVEQARVLDGDDRLGGEVLDQLDLLVGERLNLLVIDVDGANQAALLEHWNRQQSSITAELNGGAQQRIALDVSLLPRNVGDLHYLPCLEHTAKARARAGTDRSALTILGVGRRRIIERSRMKRVPVIQVQCAELGLAEARCLLQHRLEYGLQFAGRTADHLENLGRRRLPLQCLGKLARTRLKLLLQLARVRLELLLRCRLRFLRPAELTHAGRPKLRIRRSEHSTPGRPLCETVHAAGPNDGANFQVKITSLPNGLIGGTSCPRRRSHQTLTRHRGDPEPKRSFGSIDLPSSLVTDRAMEAWYNPSIAGMTPSRRVT